VTPRVAVRHEATFEVYPNPVDSEFGIKGLEEAQLIDIYDDEGRHVTTKTAVPGRLIRIQNIPPGIYVLHIGEHVLRFVKK
jgi:hypothetical protein